MKVIIFNNPSCSKCRVAMNELKSASCEIEVVEYLKETPRAAELKQVIAMLGIKPEELVRKKEALYVENYKNKKMSDAAWIRLMVKHPILIERPILISGNRAIIGRDEVALKKWLKPARIKSKPRTGQSQV